MSVDRDTFKHAAVYSFAALLGRIIGFLMLPFYAHILRDIGYGIIGMIDTALSFLMSLLAQGIRGALIRLYHDEEGIYKRRVISTGVILVGGTSLVIIIIAMLLSRPISSLLLGDAQYANLVCIALASFFFELTGQASGTLLIIERKSVFFSSIALARLLIGLGLNIYLIIILRMGLLGYFLSSLISAIIPALFLYGVMIKQCGLHFDRRIANKLIRYQLPLVPGSLASWISRQAERVLVRFLIAIESVGVLEMGYKFPQLLSLLIHRPFMRSWDTGRYAIAEEPDAPRRIGRMFTYAFFLITAAGLVLAVSIKDMLEILTPPEFWAAHRIAKIEIITAILMSSTFHLNFGIFYAKATKTWGLIRGVTSAIKLVLSFVFIKVWGLYGAAFAACAVAAITLIWGGNRGLSHYPIKVEYVKIFGLALAAVVIFLAMTNVDLMEFDFMRTLSQDKVPQFIKWLDGTRVGSWKSGVVIRILAEKADLILDMTGKILLSSMYLLFLPVVHDPTRARIKKWLRRPRFN